MNLNSEITEALKKFIPEENILENEPMSRHTMFHVGGPADCFVRVTEKSQLTGVVSLLKKAEQDYFILGNGSNLLVSDAGYRGVILCTAGGMNGVSVEDTVIRAEAGAANAVDRYDPTRENAKPERPQTLRLCSIKNNLSAIYAQSNAERI